MFLRVLLCACVVFTATAWAADPVSECNIAPEKITKLKELINSNKMNLKLYGVYTELWNARVATKTNKYCVKTNIFPKGENKLQATVTVKSNEDENVKTDTVYTLDVIDKNQYVVRNKDDIPVARIYVFYSNINVVGYFKCSLKEKLEVGELAESVVVGVRSAQFTMDLQGPAGKELNEAWKVVEDNKDVFGTIEQSEPCVIGKENLKKDAEYYKHFD